MRITSGYYTTEELMGCTHAQLDDMYTKGKKLIDITSEAKELSIQLGRVKQAVQLTVELSFLEKNVGLIGVVLMAKEDDLSMNGSIETIWLN